MIMIEIVVWIDINVFPPSQILYLSPRELVFFLGKCVRTAAKTMVEDRKYRKALALPCLMSEPLPNAANSSEVLRLYSMLRKLRKLLRYDKHGCFSWENVFGPPQKPWLWTEKKTEGTSSARFGLRTAARYGELKRCADRVGSRTDNKDEVVEGKFSKLNFLPSTKKTTEYSFELVPSIYRYLIFFLKF